MDKQIEAPLATVPVAETIGEPHIRKAVINGDWYQKRRMRLYRRLDLEGLRKLGATITKN